MIYTILKSISYLYIQILQYYIMSKHTIARQTQETSIDDSNKIQTHIREIINAEKPTIESLNKLINIVNRKKNSGFFVTKTFANNLYDDTIFIEDDDQIKASIFRCVAVLFYDFLHGFTISYMNNEYKLSREYKEYGFTMSDQEALLQLVEIFEFERVESCLAMIDEDIGKEFEKDREYRGSMGYISNRNLNPMTAVLFARDGRHDKLKGTEFEFVSDYLKQVHNMGSSDVSVKLVYDYFQKYVKDWLSDIQRGIYLSDLERDHENNIRVKQEKAKKKFSKSDLKSEIRYKERIKTLKSTISDPVKLDKKLKQCEASYKKRKNTRIDKLTKARIEISKLARDKSDIEDPLMMYSTPRKADITTHSPLDISCQPFDQIVDKKISDYIPNKSIEELKEHGTQRVNEINEYIKEPIDDKAYYKLPEYINHPIINDEEEPYEINNDVASILNDIFKQITTQYNNTNDINDTNDINNENKQKTIDIIVGVNCGSRYSYNLKIQRNICATLLKATEKLPNINIKFVSWYDMYDELYTRICETYEDIRYISIHRGMDSIHKTHQYIDDLMSKSTADKKVVIMMTDQSDDDYVGYGTQAVKNSKKSGNEVYCIIQDIGYIYNMNIIYGKDNTITCEDGEQMDKALTTLVRDLIGKQ